MPKGILITLAALLFMYAGASYFTGFDLEFKIGFVAAWACIAGVFWIDHRAAERCRMAHGREAVWRRRILEQDAWELDDEDCLREVD